MASKASDDQLIGCLMLAGRSSLYVAIAGSPCVRSAIDAKKRI